MLSGVHRSQRLQFSAFPVHFAHRFLGLYLVALSERAVAEEQMYHFVPAVTIRAQEFDYWIQLIALLKT